MVRRSAKQPVQQTSYSVPPVERAMHLLRYIGNGNRCQNLSVAARELDINRTTLIRLLHSLKANRMVEELVDGVGYTLGSGLITLAAQAIHGRDIVQVCQPLLVELTRNTGLSSHLGILDGTDVVYLSRETSNKMLISNIRAGFRLPAHASAIGRAILAAFSNDEIEALYDGVEVTAVTDKTPTTMNALMKQAKADRKNKVAWSKGNFEHNIGSCAAVILDHNARPAGALNVSGPVQHFLDPTTRNMLDVKDAILHAAQRASTGLGLAFIE